MGQEECVKKSEDRESGAGSTFSTVLWLFLFFTWLPFALRFVYKLIICEDHTRNPLVRTVLAYAASSIVSLLISIWWDIIEPIRQSKYGFSIPGCAFSDVVAWVAVLSNYILLIEILIRRLEVAFSDTIWALNVRTIRTFRLINGIHWLVSFFMCIMLSVGVDCFNVVRSGLVYKMGLAKKTYRVCSIPLPPAAVGVVVLSGFTTVAMMFGLAYIFVSRVRKVIKSTVDDHSDAMNLLIERSSVVGLASIITLFISVFLVLATDFGFLIIADSCLNLVFLYCLFGMGESFYEQLFGPLARRWLRSESTRSVPGLPGMSQLNRGISHTGTATAVSTSASGNDDEEDQTGRRMTRIDSNSSTPTTGESLDVGDHDFL